MDDLEAYASGYAASLSVDAAEGAPIESATVALNVFVLDDAPGVMQWAAGAICSLLDHGPERAGFSGTRTSTGTMWQILAYRAVPPDVEGTMTYQTVADLKDAAVAAGLPCTVWIHDDVASRCLESGTCSDSSMLSIYASEEDQLAAIGDIRQLAEDTARTGREPVYVLSGANWLIVAPEVEVLHLAGRIGGQVVFYL